MLKENEKGKLSTFIELIRYLLKKKVSKALRLSFS